MSTTEHGSSQSSRKRTSPPKFLVNIIADLLPPDCREQVLGDLEERYREAPHSFCWITYLLDANSIIPRLIWARRSSWNIRDVGPPLVLGGLSAETEHNVESVRRQVEWFQMQNYWRFLFYFGLVTVITVALGSGATQMQDPRRLAVIVGMLVILRFTAYLHRKRGGALVVPPKASLKELVAFHKSELERRHGFLRGVFYWKFLPMYAPWIVARAAQGRALEVLPVALVLLAYIFFATWVAANRVREQIDELPDIPA